MQGKQIQSWLPTLGLAPGARRRAWAALLVLAVAFASFGHVAHSHEADAPGTYQLCSFCTTFDRGGAPPPAVHVALSDVPTPVPAVPPPAAPQAKAELHLACRPRAPPVLQA
jgi:hypothetical protein